MSLRTGRGSIVKSAKCSFHLLALYSGEIIHLFVISIHSIKPINALNRNMISLPKFHSFIVWFKDICLDLMFALILPGSSSEITCRPGRYRGRSGQHVALILTQSNSYGICWGMLCVASNLQDLRRILLEQWDAIPEIRIIRLICSMRRGCQATMVPSYHGGIWRINTVLISM